MPLLVLSAVSDLLLLTEMEAAGRWADSWALCNITPAPIPLAGDVSDTAAEATASSLFLRLPYRYTTTGSVDVDACSVYAASSRLR